jgi:salicylate hydroxylase
MRDERMKMSLSIASADKWDDAMLRQQWDEISDAFGYNAREQAEDWWVKWGALGERSKEALEYDSMDLKYEVTASRFLVPENVNAVMV